MNRWQGLLVATFLFALCACWLGAAGDDPIGMVLRTRGDSLLHRSGEKRPLQVADLLYADDLLTVAGQVSFLFCPESKTYTAAQGSTLKLTAQGVQNQKGAEPAAVDSRRCTLPKVALGSESLERSGAIRVRSAGIPEVPLFVGGLVSSARPRFAWGTVEKATEYRLTLQSEKGDPIWTTTSQRPEAEFPADIPALEKGLYEWEVQAILEERAIASGRTRFEVSPNPAMAMLARDDSLLSAVELENGGFYCEAAAIYRKLSHESPADKRLSHHVAWLYQQAGLIPAADLQGP